MLKFPKTAAVAALTLARFASPSLADGDVAAGEKVFKKCKACHMVGEGAKHRVGPHLNDMFGRTAGTVEGYKYSKAMIEAGEGGLVWDAETLAQFWSSRRTWSRAPRCPLPVSKKDEDIANVTAYLKTFSAEQAAALLPKSQRLLRSPPLIPKKCRVPMYPRMEFEPSKGAFGLGRVAMSEEIAAWDIDIRPDGMGLPVGKGTVADGEPIYTEACAVCHGDFGEGAGRWPVLAGGQDSLTRERPEKTIGSYWPYLSTVFDYVRRAMPFGDARSLSDDDVYALTAYLLYLNDVVDDEEFELSNENFASVRLPNETNFFDDNRMDEPHYAKGVEPCMSDCKPGAVEITARAQVLDVTPEGEGDESTGGGID
jgi:cytochrome c2